MNIMFVKFINGADLVTAALCKNSCGYSTVIIINARRGRAKYRCKVIIILLL